MDDFLDGSSIIRFWSRYVKGQRLIVSMELSVEEMMAESSKIV
jgi:hypothetical protein